ncbi:hypothetical protein QJQ45_001093 [Haematococcus lacustris]|nr:hypothetical protein QJQ45_001093 [Haematococcus lacustris]
MTTWGKAEGWGRQGLQAQLALSIEQLCSLTKKHWDLLGLSVQHCAQPSEPSQSRWGSYVDACSSLTRALKPVTAAVTGIMQRQNKNTRLLTISKGTLGKGTLGGCIRVHPNTRLLTISKGTISKGTLGGCIRFADTGSWEKGAKDNLDLPNDTLHTTLRALGLKTATTKNTTRPDILMVTPLQKTGKRGKAIKRVTIIEIKYCADSRWAEQLDKALNQHTKLAHTIRKEGHTVEIRPILLVFFFFLLLRLLTLRKQKRDKETASADDNREAKAARKTEESACMVDGNAKMVLNVPTQAPLQQLQQAFQQHARGADYSNTSAKEATRFTREQLRAYLLYHKVPPRDQPVGNTLVAGWQKAVQKHIADTPGK